MKRIKFLSFLLIAMTAMVFTSCVDDDDDNNGLTPVEIQTAFNATRGTHTGNLLYATWDSYSMPQAKVDTLSGATWSINTDSTMTFHNIPSSVISTVVADSAIQKAIAAQPARDLNCYIGYIRLNPSVQWLINPQTVTYDNLQYRGSNHKVSIVFAVNSSYSFGQLSTTNTGSKQQMQLIAAALYIDDKIVSDGIAQQTNQSSARLRALMFIEK